MTGAMLAIELSQRDGSVALRSGCEPPRLERLDPARRSDEDLLPAIDRVVRAAGLAPRDVSSVAVSTGPGGFTGLRVAIAAAKMLGELGAAVVPVPSALVAAEAWRPAQAGVRRTALVIAATKRRGDTVTGWIATCAVEDGCWTSRRAGLRTLDDLEPSGEVLDVVLADRFAPEALRERFAAGGVDVVSPAHDALACLAVGDALLRRGATVDPVALEPIYAREPEAVALWTERHGDR